MQFLYMKHILRDGGGFNKELFSQKAFIFEIIIGFDLNKIHSTANVYIVNITHRDDVLQYKNAIYNEFKRSRRLISGDGFRQPHVKF